MKQIVFIVCIAALVLTGCTSTGAPVSTALPTQESNVSTEAIATVSPSATQPSIEEATALPVGTPTPDLRLQPEQWQDWPIVPTISTRAREIYQKGLAMGNDPHAFSKIGDCQSIPDSFMGFYDKPGEYTFAPEYASLQETVDYYQGSFGREGESVRGGFNTASVLSPMWADRQVCNAGETPMECENRVHNPSIVFISLEVWFAGRTPDVYEGYLRRIIEYNIDQGVLPILATKADNVEGDNSINYTIARLAYEYDLPLWNFWRAVQTLDYYGLDPHDQTGFHLTLTAWNVRSFTALQTLDAVRRQLQGEDVQQTATPDSTTTVSTVPTITFTPGPINGLPVGQIVSPDASAPAPQFLIGLTSRELSQSQDLGIFQGNLNGQAWRALVEPGARLLDNDANFGILAAQENNLYIIHGTDRTLLTDKLHPTSTQPAAWLADGRVAAILRGEQDQVFILDPGGAAPLAISSAGDPPLEIYPSRDPEHLYWGAGTCISDTCEVQQILSAKFDGSQAHILPWLGIPAFSSNGTMAFITFDKEHNNIITLVSGDKEVTFQVQGNRLLDMAWSPDGTRLAVSAAQVSNYSGRTMQSLLYFVTFPFTTDAVAVAQDQITEHIIWSPDGNSMLLVRRQLENGEYSLHFVVLDAVKQRELKSPGFSLIGDSYLLVQKVFWVSN